MAQRRGPDEGYEYGPPTTVGTGEDQEDAGVPQDNTDAVDVDNVGDTPMEPPADADTITEPGGSPTDEVQEAHDPSITSLTPDTAVVGTNVTVTVVGTNFSENSTVEVDQQAVATAYVSATELSATLPDPGAAGTAGVTVRNPLITEESNTVDFTWTAAEE